MRLSCLARNGRSPGEESLTAAVAVQAIEAQPAFGQIKPMRGRCSRALNSILERCQRSIGSHKKPGIPGGGKGNLAYRKATVVLEQTEAIVPDQQPRDQSADEDHRLNRSAP